MTNKQVLIHISLIFLIGSFTFKARCHWLQCIERTGRSVCTVQADRIDKWVAIEQPTLKCSSVWYSGRNHRIILRTKLESFDVWYWHSGNIGVARTVLTITEWFMAFLSMGWTELLRRTIGLSGNMVGIVGVEYIAYPVKYIIDGGSFKILILLVDLWIAMLSLFVYENS